MNSTADMIGVKAYTEELRLLLHEIEENIKAARESGADALNSALTTETRKLVEFVNRIRSENSDKHQVNKIVNIANEARRAIFGNSAEEITDRLHNRISQLDKLEEALRYQAEENERTATKLRLRPLREAVEAMTEAVEAIKAAKDALSDENSDESEVISKIESALNTIIELQNASQQLIESFDR